MIEWYFLMSVLSGPFDPALELGWPSVVRSRHTYSSPIQCLLAQEEAVRWHHPSAGGGFLAGGAAMITGCQPRPTAGPSGWRG